MKKALDVRFSKLDEHKEKLIDKRERELRLKLEMDNIEKDKKIDEALRA